MNFLSSITPIIIIRVTYGLTCNEWYDPDCYNQVLTDTYFYCYGGNSCRSSELTATVDIYCDGYYGCYANDGLTSTGGFASNIYCDGDFGCYNGGDIDASSAAICNGNRACERADSITGDYVQCNGNEACDEVDSITSYSTMYCGGHRGCASAGSIESSTGSIYCDGDHACDNVRGNIQANGNIYCDGYSGCSDVAGNITATNITC